MSVNHCLIVILVYHCNFVVTQQAFKSCEKLSTGEMDYRLDQETNECHLTGTKGPCREFMLFYKHPLRPHSKYGYCDCEQGAIDNAKPCKNHPIRKRIYVHNKRRCYTAFSQGPCRKGEWLILDEPNGGPKCVRNPCRENGTSRDTEDQFWFYDPRQRRCFKSFTKGNCPEGMHLELDHDSQYPQCRTPSCSGQLSYGIRSTFICHGGTRFSYYFRTCRHMHTAVFGVG